MLDGTEGPVTAVTQVGDVFQVDTTASKERTVLDEPAAALDQSQRRPISDALRLDGGLLAMSTGEGCDEIEVVDLSAQEGRFRRVALPDALGCPPVAFAGGLLAPTQVGQVLLLDPRSGGKLVEPFQPPLHSGEQLAWSAPAVAKGSEVVLADGRTKLYRLGVVERPQPHLAALDQATLSQPIVSPVAAIDEVVCAVDAGGVLRVFALPKLTPVEGAEQALNGRCDFGPRRVGQHVLLSSDDGRLLCLDSKGKTLWQADLPYGPLAGTPVADGAQFLLASVDGVVWRVDAATGRELGKIETGRPLGTGPLLVRGRLLLGGRDGAIYFIEPPPAP
ncbi:MAG: hypothetical protein A2V70_09985 [Planctomycetes bacterium RBG_13_63_9]|nr:MAG: hypothetical protein A2V70_09985 [Planctomycetes bacterium RBG_13_63_9]